MNNKMQRLEKKIEIFLEMMNEAKTDEEREDYQIKAYQLEKFMNQLLGNY